MTNATQPGIPPGEGPDDPASLTRRSLLAWLGNATVFALTADFLTACGGAQVSQPARAGSPGTSSGALPSPRGFTFTPSPVEGTLYDRWWGNTADPQDEAQIIAAWRLEVGGLVDQPRTFSFADLLALPRQDQVTDFHCVEGWSVLDVPWNGVHIDQIIDLVRPSAAATHVTIRSFRNIYFESLPLSVLREARSLLAFGIGGSSLPLTHGFPLRVVVPRFYGYKGPKWVAQLEFTDTPIEGYWVQRGYPSDAPVSSLRLREGKY